MRHKCSNWASMLRIWMRLLFPISKRQAQHADDKMQKNFLKIPGVRCNRLTLVNAKFRHTHYHLQCSSPCPLLRFHEFFTLAIWESRRAVTESVQNKRQNEKQIITNCKCIDHWKRRAQVRESEKQKQIFAFLVLRCSQSLCYVFVKNSIFPFILFSEALQKSFSLDERFGITNMSTIKDLFT